MQLTLGKNLVDLGDLKAALFDLDGTLIQSEHIWAAAKRQVGEDMGVSISDAVLDSFVGRSVLDFAAEVLSPRNAPQIAAEITARALSGYEGQLRPIPGAADLLRAFDAHGIRLALCSSAPQHSIHASLRLLDVAELFEVIVSAATLPRGKPDPLPYETTLEALKLSAGQAIAFEDAEAGFLSSTRAGLRTVVVGDQAGGAVFHDALMQSKNLTDIGLRN